MKKITIILITENAGETLEICLEKLTQQTLKDIEILLIDSGSTDDTLLIARKLLKNCLDCKIISREKTSLAKLRMEAISLATGKYLLFVLPTDELNIYACEIFLDAMETNMADLIIGSFIHPIYKGYLPTFYYNLSNEREKLSLRHNFLVLPLLSGKLYKKEILKKITIPEILLQEEILNLKYLELSQKVITLNQILIQSKEHLVLFEKDKFWQAHNSFWFKSIATLKEQNLIYRNTHPEFLFLSVVEHFLFETLAYYNEEATLEELTMELYSILTNDTFIEIRQALPHTGLCWVGKEKDTLLANCILFINFIIKQISLATELSLFKISILAFIKLFYHQNGSLNIEEYLGKLQENMNLKLSEEAIYIQNIDF